MLNRKIDDDKDLDEDENEINENRHEVENEINTFLAFGPFSLGMNSVKIGKDSKENLDNELRR